MPSPTRTPAAVVQDTLRQAGTPGATSLTRRIMQDMAAEGWEFVPAAQAIVTPEPANFQQDEIEEPSLESVPEPNRYQHAVWHRHEWGGHGAENMLAPASDGTGMHCGW